MLARVTSVIAAGMALAFAACDSGEDEIVLTDEPSSTPTPTVSQSNTPSPSASPVPPTLAPNPTDKPPDFAPPTTAPALLDALEGGRAQWDAAGLKDYQYDLTLACFCGLANMPIKIVVRAGELRSMAYSTGVPATPGWEYDLFMTYSTIDHVFDQMAVEIQTPNRYLLEATFDTNLGFPTRIVSDSFHVTDSGMYVSITNFEVLP